MENNIDKIHIYHTNDIHSHFESWPEISRFLQSRKSLHESAEESCFVFDIGDYVDRSDPFTEATNGKGNVELLNRAGYDAVTIGNNEGITMSHDALTSLYKDAQFDVILGNLFKDNGERPEWLVPYKLYSTANGTKVGIIGATAEYQLFYSKLGWQITPPREQLKKLAEQIKGETDLLICLSHMGIGEDERLANECNCIDVILGAHTHHLFHEGKQINNSLLAATGKYGEYVGHVTIEYNCATHQINHQEAKLYQTELLEKSTIDREDFIYLMEIGKGRLTEPVFYNPKQMPRKLFSDGPLTSFFSKALLSYTKADCVMFNAGIFLDDLEEGWVTRGDLHSILPHPINPCTITLDGADLAEVYELSLNEDLPDIQVRGLGFRGAQMGAMIRERLYKDGEGQLFAGNQKVVAGQNYTLATLDMFTFGFFFPSLKDAEIEYYMPELIRDVFGWYGMEHFKH
ncbi:bifunctional UDP-sugar hydrolase/5'-nucleotidase [Filibacter tadaridae]|uniref:Endonuclease YhcR n=1 Tax=Filibacter tadaridae TaxID=2483811 RepID=A0A3P5XBJ9_9BACL|nr:bifunctional UDP-sugar hydrolase/5'-nucleotidase [Filibacter tadaridae]VDC31966.1 Endonuclease YhcR precursor [Filibacter tadaridae]